MRYPILCSLTAALLLVGCGSPADNPDYAAAVAESPEADRLAIAEKREAMTSAVVAGDYETYIAGFTDDIVVMQPGLVLRGSEAADYIRGLEGSATINSFDFQPEELWVHGDAAYEYGSYSEDLVWGGQEMLIENNYFTRWEKGDDGEWRWDRVVIGPVAAPESE